MVTMLVFLLMVKRKYFLLLVSLSFLLKTFSLTYLCSGSGKTYTMEGGQGIERGISFRTIEKIFNLLQYRVIKQDAMIQKFENSRSDTETEEKIFHRYALQSPQRCHLATNGRRIGPLMRSPWARKNTAE